MSANPAILPALQCANVALDVSVRPNGSLCEVFAQRSRIAMPFDLKDYTSPILSFFH